MKHLILVYNQVAFYLMPEVVKIKVKKKKNIAELISIFCFVLGVFLLLLGYIGNTYDIADFSNSNGVYDFRGESSIFYGHDHIIGALVGLCLIFIGFLIKYRKRITKKIKHISSKKIKNVH